MGARPCDPHDGSMTTDPPEWPSALRSLLGALGALLWIAGVIVGSITLGVDRLTDQCSIERGMFVYHVEGNCAIRITAETMVGGVLLVVAPFVVMALVRRAD